MSWYNPDLSDRTLLAELQAMSVSHGLCPKARLLVAMAIDAQYGRPIEKEHLRKLEAVRE